MAGLLRGVLGSSLCYLVKELSKIRLLGCVPLNLLEVLLDLTGAEAELTVNISCFHLPHFDGCC